MAMEYSDSPLLGLGRASCERKETSNDQDCLFAEITIGSTAARARLQLVRCTVS
jgi:hypothetical protein